MPEIQLQRIVGRKVHDVDGNVAGRIGEVMAERTGADCHVTEYLLGPAAFLYRLGMRAGKLVGWKGPQPLRVPWHQMDVENLRLKCRVEDLKRGDR